jgi:hypothetical protein
MTFVVGHVQVDLMMRERVLNVLVIDFRISSAEFNPWEHLPSRARASHDVTQTMHPFGGTAVCPRCNNAVYAAEQVSAPFLDYIRRHRQKQMPGHGPWKKSEKSRNVRHRKC